jgi:hypothetical protein
MINMTSWASPVLFSMALVSSELLSNPISVAGITVTPAAVSVVYRNLTGLTGSEILVIKILT